jgi:hypothetical protein
MSSPFYSMTEFGSPFLSPAWIVRPESTLCKGGADSDTDIMADSFLNV